MAPVSPFAKIATARNQKIAHFEWPAHIFTKMFTAHEININIVDCPISRGDRMRSTKTQRTI